ncbi:MAG: hypothetical protein JNL49_10595 [Bacteroidia bacterium]|nr:hypothetical protein [Bacteroidia bacterium]
MEEDFQMDVYDMKCLAKFFYLDFSHFHVSAQQSKPFLKNVFVELNVLNTKLMIDIGTTYKYVRKMYFYH